MAPKEPSQGKMRTTTKRFLPVTSPKPRPSSRHDMSSALKAVKADYTQQVGQIVSTMRALIIVGDAMGTDVLGIYEGTFDAGQLGFRQAKASVDKAAENRTRN